MRYSSTAAMLAALWLSGCAVARPGAVGGPPTAAPDRVERYGEFEVVTHSHGRRNANDDNRITDESWSLRRNGEPVVIDSYGGMWLDEPLRTSTINALFIVGSRELPEMIVNVGDPNNAGLFHLLRVQEGRITAPVLCRTFGGNSTLRVLRGGTGPDERFTGPQLRSLADARHVLLGDACLYDVAARRTRELPRPPDGAAFPPGNGAVMLSPDGRSIARAALLTATGTATVLVADLDSGQWTELPIDPRRMRHAQFEAIDAAWIAHHFEWRRVHGRDRLAERASFKPLPRRGAFMAGQAQYEVPEAVGDHGERLGQFMVRRFDAKRLPDPPGGNGRMRTYQVEGVEVSVFANGFFIAQTGKPYTPGRPGDPAWQLQLAHRIGDAFDAELAAGLHDAMFAPGPAPR